MVQIIAGNSHENEEKTERSQKILQKMREASIEEEAAVRATQHNLYYIDLHIFPIDTEDVLLVPEADARQHNIALFHKKNLIVRIALLDPSNDTLEYIHTLTEKNAWQAELYIISPSSLNQAWKHYAKRTLIDTLDLIRVSLSDTDLAQFDKNFSELISLTRDSSFNTSRALEIILSGAKKLHASDIHIEPGEDSARLRYRIDGVLQDIGQLPPHLHILLLSRIKMLGKMRLNIRNEAQDGHFFIDLDGKRIDIRVNSIPGKYGDNINMRLLSSEDVIVEVTKLGLRHLAYEEVLKQASKPNGLILNTGPTGSGKTTTLYTLLNHINQSGTKIITVEDPIEYSIPGIVQTEISKNKHYTFATALRAIVRQDPDVILVGEIRDDETADITINASLTGHLVFSTLHSNSASASIPRLIELGVKPSLVVASLNALIGQRLVRVLCEHCKETYVPAQETVSTILRLITIISPKAKVLLPQTITHLHKAVGCVKCHFTGYHGRIGIFEVMTMTPEISDIINNFGTEQEILRAALENGMVTMTQDGLLKTLEGITTLDEVYRVTDQTESLQNVYAELMPNELSRATHISTTVVEQTRQAIASIEKFSTYVQGLSSEQVLSSIFSGALLMRAGDIHIEPTETDVDVRFRIDGILQSVTRLPLAFYPTLVGEIKLAAGLKSTERSGTTEGRFALTLETPIGTNTASVDIRLSIILSGFGETMVMRLLNQSIVQLNLTDLHIRPKNLDRILSAISKPNGLILNTGPTGSGKTTTLYSILARLNTPAVKIITVEDPIEYKMPGILQTQIKESEDYTFANALRSLLRQNPDILMIGEIRDEETARIAIQAAGTGHLVLSTLHANSASGIISRLTSMGISADDIANTGGLFIAQRLVRKICQECRVSAIPNPTELALLEKTLALVPDKDALLAHPLLWHGKGCSACHGTGFFSQIIIVETLPIEKEIAKRIASGAITSEIEETAVRLGMLTLAQDGILAVLEGDTTLEEVRRVTDL
ncbi:MAG: GspE/PulE family protein [Minisyncoccota bacterium]